MSSKRLTAILIIALALPSICLAGPFEGRRGHYKERAQIEKKVRTMKIWKMTEELDLTEAQALRFFPMLNEMEKQFDEIRDQRKEIADQLGEQVWQEEASIKKIEELIDGIEELGLKEMEMRKQFRLDASQVLDPVQMGKMVLFNMHFPQIMRDMIRDIESKGFPPGKPEPRGLPPHGR